MKKYTRNYIRSLSPLLERIGLYNPPGYGLNGLDKKLLNYVTGRNGIFVEAGANDGLSQSNTAFLERFRGWRGLLIEPIPELAHQSRLNRRRAIVEQCALVADADHTVEVEMIYCNLMSIVEGARGSQEDDSRHIERGTKFLAAGDQPRRYTVPTATLDGLFLKHGLTRVDLLSLDVEGYEPQALMGLDLNRLAPTWVLVEANDPQAIENALGDGYEHIADLSHHDRLYRFLK